MMRETPNAFVWTKIQAEGGQGVEKILNRKQSECQSGGTFWWGIGESKAGQIGLVLERNPVPDVIFSQMRSPPHHRDSHPGSVVMWRAYETEDGDVPIPPHVVVTSRAHDRKGREKQHHYALVCKDLARIPLGKMLDSGKLRNFGKDGKKSWGIASYSRGRTEDRRQQRSLISDYSTWNANCPVCRQAESTKKNVGARARSSG